MYIYIYIIADEFSTYMHYVRQLDFYESPDYDYMRRLFSDAMSKNRWEFDWEFDWTNRLPVSVGTTVSFILLLFNNK